MSRSFRTSTFLCFVVIALCWLACIFGTGMAQITTRAIQGGYSESVNVGGVDQQGISTRIAPPVESAQIGIVSTGNAFFGLQDKTEVVKNRPYQAQATTEITQTLANGTHITQTITATVARDSEGRTVRTQKMGTIGPWMSSFASNKGNSPVLTTIFDPVKGVHIDYTSDRSVAHVMVIPTLPPGGTAAIGIGGLPGSSTGPVMIGTGPEFAVAVPLRGTQGHAASSPASGGLETKTKSLGTKTIEGLQVVGTRNTTTIPKGTIGNDKDIVITHETWYSPKLKVVILSIHDDPRFGRTTYSLTKIRLREPSKTQFQIPAGYKIEKLPPPTIITMHQ
ncbi:MAG: hypothetical protein ACRD28_09925 [Acidobacteriaceae bacterium]